MAEGGANTVAMPVAWHAGSSCWWAQLALPSAMHRREGRTEIRVGHLRWVSGLAATRACRSARCAFATQGSASRAATPRKLLLLLAAVSMSCHLVHTAQPSSMAPAAAWHQHRELRIRRCLRCSACRRNISCWPPCCLTCNDLQCAWLLLAMPTHCEL